MGEAATAKYAVRLISYNVCGFGAGFGPADAAKVTETYGRIRKDLERLQPDIVCLQEAKRLPLRDPEGREHADSLEALAHGLGGLELRFAHANPGFESFGNAVLVGRRLRLLRSDSAFLAGGSVIQTPAGVNKRIGRGCLAVELAPGTAEDTSSFAVLVTHWDHISEGERVTQAHSLLDMRAELCRGLPHLLVGDLNSMKRSDYSASEWALVEERNSQRGWKPPVDSDALAFLEQQGYVDVHQKSWGDSSRWSVGGPPPVRIDYAFASADWPWASGELEARVDVDAASSDHQPLVLDLLLGA